MINTPRVILVTGAFGYLGWRLLAELENTDGVDRIIAVDLEPAAHGFKKVVFRKGNVTQSLKDLFAREQPDAVIPLAFSVQPNHHQQSTSRLNINGLKNVLEACEYTGVQYLLYLSSHTVYGAHANNLIPLTEEDPLRPLNGFQYALDKANCEMILHNFSSRNPHIAIGILRSCVVLCPGSENFITRTLFRPTLVRLSGYNPPIQFIHQRDLLTIMIRFLRERIFGTYNVAGTGTMTYSQIANQAQSRMILLPPSLAYLLLAATWTLHLQNESPPAGLNFIRYPCVLSTDKLSEKLRFTCRYTTQQTLQDYLQAR